MIRNYFTLAFRHLLKNKLFSFIKLFGFTIGIAACYVIGLYLHNELGYDKMHVKKDRIVKMNMEIHDEGETHKTSVSGTKAGPSFKEDFPEVEDFVRLIRYSQIVEYNNEKIEESGIFYADSTFYNFFSFSLLRGNPATALNAPNKVVLTEATAERYFGQANPLGKSIKLGTREYEVTGVMSNPPPNTHIKPKMVASFISLSASKTENLTWWNANYATYLLLQQASNRESIQGKIREYMASHNEETGLSGDSYVSFGLEPLEDLHLRSEVEGNFEPTGDMRYIYILIAVAFLILLIAVTTYINLTTAASTERAKAVGIHKVMGARKGHLAAQHFGEAMILTFVALLLALLIVPLILPLFNQLFDRSLTMEPLLKPMVLLGISGFGLLVSFLAGFYPAIVVSNFKPVQVLKGQFKFSNSGTWLRKSLVVTQFAISILLIICTLILQQQMNYIQNKKLGYQKDQILILPADRQINKDYEAIKNSLLREANIQGVTKSYETPVRIEGGYSMSVPSKGIDSRPVTAIPIGLDFLKTLDMNLLTGRDFDQGDLNVAAKIWDDSTAEMPVLINESLAESLGWTAESAVGQFVQFRGSRNPIKGVLKDFHFSSMHEEIKPLLLFPEDYGRVILVKLGGQNLDETLAGIETIWGDRASHRPFSYHFMDEEFDKMYLSEIQTTGVVSAFAWIAILLACLGLFGLATYNFVQRTKEIGVRKVLGATTMGIVSLLSKDFLKLVVVALIIASPIAWYFMNGWLENFTYRVDVSWWVFAVAGLGAMAIAFLTVGIQGVRAALANPIEALRSE